MGGGVGWLAPALPLLLSDKSPLKSNALSTEQLSWIGSSPPLGAIVGNFIAGYSVTKIGAKQSIMLLGIPQLVH